MVDKEYPSIVKFHVDEDGQKVDNKPWHFVYYSCSDPCAFCNGQHFGYGMGRINNENGLDYEEKRGKITCKSCRAAIKDIKDVRL